MEEETSWLAFVERNRKTMLTAFTRFIKRHLLGHYPTWQQLRSEGVEITNIDYFGDPRTFLQMALKNKYINRDTPAQVWKNLLQLCLELGVPHAVERIGEYRQRHFGLASSAVDMDHKPCLRNGVPYRHNETFHNMIAPRIIVRKLFPVLRPGSVVDVGCGLGTFLRAFREVGTQTILGIDGDWVDRELLVKNISLSEFMPADLQEGVSVNARFDLVISLEVAEHLCPESAEVFVESLVALGDVILFSAATPVTWYDSSHLNNQWPDYWSDRFAKHGYFMQDVVRHIVYRDVDVSTWYKTNMFLVTKGMEEQLCERLLQLAPENLEAMKTSAIFRPVLSTSRRL